MTIYTARTELKPSGLVGISDKQIDEHWKLYEGYVKQTNGLIDELKLMREEGKGGTALYADRRRRFEFEMCGMLVHDYYFANLKAGVSDSVAPTFKSKIAETFGSFENWLADFKAAGATRGVGHAICYMDPMTGNVNNHFITLHGEGHMPGYHVLLSMDVWEHAFLIDYGVLERGKYIEAFMQNVNWEIVEERTQNALAHKTNFRWAL